MGDIVPITATGLSPSVPLQAFPHLRPILGAVVHHRMPNTQQWPLDPAQGAELAEATRPVRAVDLAGAVRLVLVVELAEAARWAADTQAECEAADTGVTANFLRKAQTR